MTVNPSTSTSNGTISADSSPTLSSSHFLDTITPVPHLFIHLVEARDLAAKDSNGLSDPYCTFKFERETWKSTIFYKNLNPHWNESYVVYAPTPTSTLRVYVFDKDRLTADDFLGYFSVPLQSIRSEQLYDCWYTLKRRKTDPETEIVEGAVHLRLQYLYSGTNEFDAVTRQTWAPKYKPLFPYFSVKSLLPIALTRVVGSGQIEGIANALVRLCTTQDIIDVVQNAISFEVDQSNSVHTLFRQNSIGSKLISHIGFKYGLFWIRTILNKPVVSILKKSPDFSLEINPIFVSNEAQLATQLAQLEKYCESIFRSLSTVPFFPESLRKVCHFVHDSTEKKYPGFGLRSVSAFLFLRLLCPALVSPQQYSIVDGFHFATNNQNLISIAKVIQQVSTLSPPVKRLGTQERLTNPFIVKHIPTVTNICKRMLTLSPTVPSALPESNDPPSNQSTKPVETPVKMNHHIFDFSAKAPDDADTKLPMSPPNESNPPNETNISDSPIDIPSNNPSIGSNPPASPGVSTQEPNSTQDPSTEENSNSTTSTLIETATDIIENNTVSMIHQSKNRKLKTIGSSSSLVQLWTAKTTAELEAGRISEDKSIQKSHARTDEEFVRLLKSSSAAFKAIHTIHRSLLQHRDALIFTQPQFASDYAIIDKIGEPPKPSRQRVHNVKDSVILREKHIYVEQTDDQHDLGISHWIINSGFNLDDVIKDPTDFSTELSKKAIDLGKAFLSKTGQTGIQKKKKVSRISRLLKKSSKPTEAGSSDMSKDTGKLTGEEPIDWNKMAQSDDWLAFWKKTCLLKQIDPFKLVERNAKMTFWINIYNALMFAAIEMVGVVGISRPAIFQSPVFQIGKFKFSLDDIKHGILLGNRPNPHMPNKSQTTFFETDDERSQLSFEHPDCRCLFLLSEYCVSSPTLRPVYQSKLGYVLEAATAEYLRDSLQINLEQNVIVFPKILEWYKPEFLAAQSTLLDFCALYLEPEDMLLIHKLKEPTCKFAEFNWAFLFQPIYSMGEMMKFML